MIRKKIYLIEDDPSLILLLKTLFEIEGYQVRNPPINRLNIVGSIITENPDLILLDVILGKLNGLDILRKIKEIKQLRNKKVLMTSGTYLKKECMEAGADGFVMKPFIPEELMTKIRVLTGG